MKKIRLGHIGTKHDHSSGKLECVRKYPDLFEVVGLVEDDDEWYESKIRNSPVYAGIPRMTEEELLAKGIDAALIEGFEYDLPFAALRMVENGVHVHIDKPAGRDIETFTEVLRTAKRKNLTVQMAYMYRYNPAYLDLKKLIAEGRMGDIVQVNAIMNVGHSVSKRQWLSSFDGGMMFYLGCHMVDFVYDLMGKPEKIVPFLKCTGTDGVTALDNCTAIFEYKNGTSIVQSVASEIGGFERRQLVAVGTKATYEIRPLERPTHAYITEQSFAEPFVSNHVERELPYLDTKKCRYDAMMQDFAAMIRGEKENPYSFEYELEMQKLVLAACGYSLDWKTDTVL